MLSSFVKDGRCNGDLARAYASVPATNVRHFCGSGIDARAKGGGSACILWQAVCSELGEPCIGPKLPQVQKCSSKPLLRIDVT